MFFSKINTIAARGAASMSSQKKARGLPGMDSLDGNLVSLYVMLCEYVKEDVTDFLFCCFTEVTMTVVKSVSDGLRDSETQLNLNRPLRISPGPRHLSRPLAT